LTLAQDVHLTNVAVQKTAPDYDPEKGCKWSLHQLRQYLTAKHGIDSVSVIQLQYMYLQLQQSFLLLSSSLLGLAFSSSSLCNQHHCQYLTAKHGIDSVSVIELQCMYLPTGLHI
jgi:hypothetical protein